MVPEIGEPSLTRYIRTNQSAYFRVQSPPSAKPRASVSITPDDFRAQVETNLFGPINVTRAVLPIMRAQRSGLVAAISSTAGLVGQEFCSAYARRRSSPSRAGSSR